MHKETANGTDTKGPSLKWYYFWVVLSQLLAVIALIMLGVLFDQYRGGYRWGSDPEKVFNFHPLFMTLGIMFFYGEALLSYRVLRDANMLLVKCIHAIFLAMSFILSVIGLKGVYDSHKMMQPRLPNLGSLHSWIGIGVIILFFLQWICGFFTYMFPKLSEGAREKFMPIHKYWGKLIYTLGIVAFMTGVTHYGVMKGLVYNEAKEKERDLLFISAIFFLVFGLIVLFLLGDNDFKRPAEKKDDEHMPLTE